MGFNSSMPPGVKLLLTANVAVFLISLVGSIFIRGFAELIDHLFGLQPIAVFHGYIWQLFTWMFLHADFSHIGFNMLSLWMFGVVLEGTWGTRRFLRYYFICGVGSGICVVLGALIFHQLATVTVGASGAIFGVLLAFGIMYPNAPVLMFFVFPVPARYFVIFMGAISFFFVASGSSGNVSHVAHLGGILVGYLYMRAAGFTGSSTFRIGRFGGYGTGGYGGYGSSRRSRFSMDSLRQKYQDWNRRRLRKKFEVYMRDNDRNDHIN
jgi:membrane associated rhomboid family serine protease